MLNDPYENYYVPIACLSSHKDIKVWKAVSYDSYHHPRGDVILKLITVPAQDLKNQLLYSITRRYYVEHPNIVTQWSAFSVENNSQYSSYRPSLCVIEEYFSRCSLLNLVHFLNKAKTLKPLTSSQIASILYEICNGLKYLHCDMRCAHQRLSLSTVLINRESSSIKISLLEKNDDCRFFVPPEKKKKVFCADPLELALADDIWSLGVLALEIVAGNTGHRDEVNWKMIEDFSIISCSVERSVFTTSYVSATARNFAISAELLDFICCCLRKDPAARPSIEKVMNHYLFSAGTCKDNQTRRRHMESIVHGVVYKCCRGMEESNVYSSVPFVLGSRKESVAKRPTVERNFKWAFPVDIADTIASNESDNTVWERKLVREEEPCDSRETSKVPTNEGTLIPTAEDTFRILDQFKNVICGSSTTLTDLRTSMSIDDQKEIAKFFSTMTSPSQPATSMLCEMLDHFISISNDNPDFPVSFCKVFAAELSKGDKQKTLDKNISIIRSILLLSKFSSETNSARQEEQETEKMSDPSAQQEGGDIKRELNTRESLPDFMPTSTNGMVNVPHYLFNKWVRDKQPSLFE